MSNPASSTDPQATEHKEEDKLNAPFSRLSTIKEATSIYLAHGDAFHIDQTSGGERERAEQTIKLILALASPYQE